MLMALLHVKAFSQSYPAATKDGITQTQRKKVHRWINLGGLYLEFIQYLDPYQGQLNLYITWYSIFTTHRK